MFFMFWDFIFSTLFMALVIYLFMSIFIDTTEFEWNVVRWFRRVFRLCNHPYGREYKVTEYLFANMDEHPHVVYETRCGSCHKDTGTYILDVEDILDINNLCTSVDGQWHCMNIEEFDIVKKKGTKIG